MSRLSGLKTLVLVSVLALISLPAIAGLPYVITDLGPDVRPAAINSAGDIVGNAVVPGAGAQAFLWKDRVLTPLGRLPNGHVSWADDINDAGIIVGGSAVSGDHGSHALMWQDRQMTDLGAARTNSTDAHAINNFGSIAMTYDDVSFGPRPLSWSNGVFTEIAQQFRINGTPVAINDHGDMLGVGQALGHDALWMIRNGQLGQVTPPTSWPVGADEPSALNNRGDFLVNGALSSDIYYGYLYENGVPRKLQPLSGYTASWAEGLNELGQVVGYSAWDPTNDMSGRACMWENGTVIDLNRLLPYNSGWKLMETYDINNGGQIVGIGNLHGALHGFVLAPIPEPGTLSLMAVGLIGLASRRKRRTAS